MYVYLVRNLDGETCKVGKTGDLTQRLAQLGKGVVLVVKAYVDSDDAADFLERRIQLAFQNRRIGQRGEWFTNIRVNEFRRAVKDEMAYCIESAERMS